MTMIQRLVSAALALTLCATLTGCFKSEMKLTFGNDGTAKLELSQSLNESSLDQMLAMIEQMGGGEEGADEAVAAMEEMEESMSAPAMRKTLEGFGLEVTEATAIEEDGWIGSKVKANVKDVNAAIAKMDKAMGEMAKEASEEGMDLPFDASVLVPRFYKTDKPGIGEIELMPSVRKLMAEAGMDLDEAMAEMSDEELEQAQGMIEMFKGMFGIDTMKMGMEIVLPGEIVSVTGAKKDPKNAKLMRFTMKGGDISVDSLKTMMGLADGVRAQFKIPEGCKINFVERKAAKKAEDGEEKKDEKRSGGLRIGGEGGGR